MRPVILNRLENRSNANDRRHLDNADAQLVEMASGWDFLMTLSLSLSLKNCAPMGISLLRTTRPEKEKQPNLMSRSLKKISTKIFSFCKQNYFCVRIVHSPYKPSSYEIPRLARSVNPLTEIGLFIMLLCVLSNHSLSRDFSIALSPIGKARGKSPQWSTSSAAPERYQRIGHDHVTH